MASDRKDEPEAKPATATATALPDRGKRLSNAAKDALGAGVGAVGEGVAKIGEGVAKIGDLSRKVPVVGSSVAKIGEGIRDVGEQIHVLPKVARTRRGRLLIRSMIVGFVLVATWIVVIVALQLHGNDIPDFRPDAEHILVEISKGSFDDLYEQASPRFQEIERKEQFVDDMTDLAQTVGKFREITAVNDTLLTTGASGKVGRISLTVKYDKAICKVSVSLHSDQGRWKLLGIGIELPDDFKITQADREKRTELCGKDVGGPMSSKCEVHQVADEILRELRDGNTEKVWDDATSVFQQQEAKAKFVQLETEHIAALGRYRRIIAVSEAKQSASNGNTSATFDALAEFDRASGVRVVFGFYRRVSEKAWKLRSFKIVLPIPRGSGDDAPGNAGSGSGSAGSGAGSGSSRRP